MDAPAVLTIRDYSVSYATERGTLRVLEHIDLVIGKGEVVGLVGESGSGKSTLAFSIMRALRGRVAKESGDILLGSDSLLHLDAAGLNGIRGRRVAMVFQDPGSSLNPTLTLRDHFLQVLDRHRDLTPDETESEIRRLLDMVDLPDPDLMAMKYPHEVSGGEKQRAVIALVLASNPELILFDEPTTALDATTAVNILELFRDLQRQTGVSALFISHDLGVVREIAHRVAVIYAGRIVEIGTISALFGEPRHPYTRSLFASLPKPSIDGRSRSLVAIPGTFPDGTVAISGCNFADRCRFATEQCREGVIGLDADPEHPVACPYWRTAIETSLASDDRRGEVAAAAKEGAVRLSVQDLSVRISRPDLFARLLGREPRTVHAVNNVDLTLHAGETLGLVGESGCGKSSLARALTGLRDFTGHILLEDRPITSVREMGRRFRRRVQIIFQNPDLSLNPRQTIATILSRPLKLYRRGSSASLDDRIAALLRRVNLAPDFASRHPHELSGGEKQRIAIARALAAEPEVIICDEITSGLDASVQASIVNLLQKIQAENGVSYLFITHDLNLLRHIADRVAVMYLGEIVEIRNADRIGAPPYHPYTEALLGSAPILEPSLELRRVRLQGNLPSRAGRLEGCPFESRCPRRLGGLCRTDRPPRRELSRDHWIRCHIEAPDLCAVPPIWRHADHPPTDDQGDTGHA